MNIFHRLVFFFLWTGGAFVGQVCLPTGLPFALHFGVSFGLPFARALPADHSRVLSRGQKSRVAGLKNIRIILNLPLENRRQALASYGTKGFRLLKMVVFSEKESMPTRWKALTSLARLDPERALPVVQKALSSPVWFLQNAGLIAMEIIDPARAVKWAGYFLSAKALVVRTAAVDMIKRHRAVKYKPKLLEQLNAKESFYRKKSLWIRGHIVQALAVMSVPGEEQLFMSFLRDSDTRLHAPAMLALQKLTHPKGEQDFNNLLAWKRLQHVPP